MQLKFPVTLSFYERAETDDKLQKSGKVSAFVSNCLEIHGYVEKT
ncbi:hypothetical protein JCM19238_1911 [Vibrio ponticus]|nr:hypothetical protein JCM19238_1911 [Vibrio ponticus]